MTAYRKPAVAGMFYEDDVEELKAGIEALFLGPLGPGRLPVAAPFVSRDIVGLVSPHAGYQYSGYAAASAYVEVAEDGLPDSVVIIGPNHRGTGEPVAVVSRGAWSTPLGEVSIDEEIADSLLSGSDYLAIDPLAHQLEHSIEVQIPFLQFISASAPKIVPITISALTRDSTARLVTDLGDTIAAALSGKNAIVISSTDLTHYESQQAAKEKDQLVIRAVEELDAEKLLSYVEQYNITMCGAVPTAITIAAAKGLGATRAELLTYYTSGDILGDHSQVVGYASLKMVRGS